MKVKIPAIIAPNGKWCAYGYPDAVNNPDWSMMEEIADNDGTEYQRIWITVDLPAPRPIEVEAEEVSA